MAKTSDMQIEGIKVSEARDKLLEAWHNYDATQRQASHMFNEVKRSIDTMFISLHDALKQGNYTPRSRANVQLALKALEDAEARYTEIRTKLGTDFDVWQEARKTFEQDIKAAMIPGGNS